MIHSAPQTQTPGADPSLPAPETDAPGSQTELSGAETDLFTEPTLLRVGQTGKVHGVKGELELYLTVSESLLCAHRPFLFVAVDGLPVPFRVEALRSKGAALLVQLRGVDTVEAAKRYRNSPVFLPDSYLADQQAEFTWEHFLEFTVLDPRGVPVGVVTEVNDATQNILFEVETPQGHRFLLPVQEELIQDIDPSRATITLVIPEGITDL